MLTADLFLSFHSSTSKHPAHPQLCSRPSGTVSLHSLPLIQWVTEISPPLFIVSQTLTAEGILGKLEDHSGQGNRWDNCKSSPFPLSFKFSHPSSQLCSRQPVVPYLASLPPSSTDQADFLSSVPHNSSHYPTPNSCNRQFLGYLQTNLSEKQKS